MTDLFPAGGRAPGRPASPDEAWFAAGSRRPDADVRLYCFPFVGSGAKLYLPLARFLPATVELRSLELPGHGTRDKEPLVRDVARLARVLAAVVAGDAAGRPFAFFGHCTGGLLAYETACALAAARLPGPVLLAVSAMVPPRAFTRHFADSMRRPAVTALVSEALADARQRRVTVEAVAKWELSNYLMHTPTLAPPLTCPVTVTGGHADLFFRPDQLDGWAAHTTAGPVPVRLYPGRHLYLLDHWARLAKDLAGDLGPAALAVEDQAAGPVRGRGRSPVPGDG
ncbi:thioesterase II family protein [Streptomyces sp. URMC 127]|uniref:thioesterase II family protein n=1 Tax=Streptomyces sp. URMC 127 TaxID=3423402 RepID=UPI003F1C2BB9